MRIQLQIDGYNRSIDSRDPETVARWLLEVFSDTHWTPATYCVASVYPTFSPSPAAPQGQPDWITDARFWRPVEGTKTPRKFVAELSARLDELELEQ